jgi:transposase
MEIRTLPLDHIGLVSGVFDQLDIADLIDDRLPTCLAQMCHLHSRAR